jgi:tetraacyldisaccharide 4'-kinase
MKPPELLYYLGYSIHKRRGTKQQKKLPGKVISIGNITLGGTGKTPATIALAHEAKKRGFAPCILTRGYRGKAKGPCFVSVGAGPLLKEYDAGDEAFLMAEKLQGVPVVKGQNRYEAGLFALENLQSHMDRRGSEWLFILDDGFQHWGLFRDKDILLVDGTNPFGNRKLLPLGSLREPIKAIRRADIVVITKADGIPTHHLSPITYHPAPNDLIAEIQRYSPYVPIFFSEHRPVAFATDSGSSYSLDWAKGKAFFAFCGIGNPHSFRHTLGSIGADIKGLKSFRDHYRFTEGDIQAIAADAEKSGAAWIVTTEKDIMRLKGFNLPENLVALVIEFGIDEKFYDEVFRFERIYE